MKKWLLLASVLTGCTTQQNNTSSTQESFTPGSPLIHAVDLIESNHQPEAKKILEDFVAARPAHWAHRIATEKQVQVYFWDKEQLAECGLFEIVAAKNKKMVPVMDASYSKAYYLLAFIALESRNNPYNNAMANLNLGLALEPDQPTLLYEKANLYYRTKHADLAIEEYQRLIATEACFTNPQKARAYRGMGEALISLARYDEAEQAYYASLKFDPENKKAIAELDYVDKIRNLNRKNNSLQ